MRRWAEEAIENSAFVTSDGYELLARRILTYLGTYTAHPEDAQPEPGWLWRRNDMSPEKTYWQFVRDLDRIPVDRDRAEVRRFYFAHPEDAPGGPWIDFGKLNAHHLVLTVGATIPVISGPFAGQRGRIVEVDYGTQKARLELALNREVRDRKGDET
jgi:hypothetical protein